MAVKAAIVPEHLHTALRVRDLEGALRFYSEVIGLQVQRVGGPDPSRPGAVWLQGVQLVRAAEQDTAEKELEGPIRETTLPDGQKMRLVFFRDPEGNRIELTQR